MSHYSTAHSGIREFGLGRRLPVGSGRDEAGLVGEHHRLHPGKACSWQTKMASAWLSVKSTYCTRDQPNLNHGNAQSPRLCPTRRQREQAAGAGLERGSSATR